MIKKAIIYSYTSKGESIQKCNPVRAALHQHIFTKVEVKNISPRIYLCKSKKNVFPVFQQCETQKQPPPDHRSKVRNAGYSPLPILQPEKLLQVRYSSQV